MSKMRIAFYISTSSISHADLRYPEKGNPGIGATQYLFILIASQLTLRYKDSMNIVLMTDGYCKLPSYLDIIEVDDVYRAISEAKKLSIDLLIIRTVTDSKLYNYIDEIMQNVVTWSHNRLWGDTANMITNSKYVVRNICVGVRQALEIVDHDLYQKTEVIFNPVIINNSLSRDVEVPIVTYIGHIDKRRGFHLLAKIWKDILKKVPSAQLYIIGSAALYDRNIKMGKLGIATEEYENMFIRHITSDDGKLLKSVRFLGIIGQEKVDIYKKTAVGVINPTGYETLGVSGLEMEACGIPIVTINKYGQSEIVKHDNTGYLFNNTKQFKEYLIKLLIDMELNNNLGNNARKFVNNKYNIEKILESWKLEFEDILLGKSPTHRNMTSIENNIVEKIRIFNSRIRVHKYFRWIPSSLDVCTLIRKSIHKIIK